MSNDSFKDKFKEQIQIMGKGGISSIGSTQAINEYQNKNNIYLNQQPQNMMNVNYENIMPQQQINSGNEFSGWA